jgi:hypothetical protein
MLDIGIAINRNHDDGWVWGKEIAFGSLGKYFLIDSFEII